MPRDAKPSEIELKRDDFSTEKQEIAAERLQEHWDSNCEFKELAEELYPGEGEPSASLYRKVYNEYFGPVGDRRTFEEIRAQFESVGNYLEERKKGNVDLEFGEPENDESDIEEIRREAYRSGYDDGFENGYDKGHESGFEKGYQKGREERVGELAEIAGLDE